jgi:hypothetical protein
MAKITLLLLVMLGLTALMPAGGYAQTSRKSVPASEVNGTFRMGFTGKFRGNYNEVKIWALGGGRLRFAMDLTHPYTMANGELMANTGQLDGEMSIKGDTAVFSSTEFGKCTITIKFVKPGLIKVTEDADAQDCGFGNNVDASGTYKKVSGKKPSFERE